MSVFGHGQLRLYLLALLREGPRHGYDIIRDLENRFSGMYSPSPGTVYPRLSKLEEEGLVERTDEGRKALYRLTDAGRAEAGAREEEIAALESSLDASADRLAEEMRRRVRAGSEDLRSEVAAATAHLRGGAGGSSSARWSDVTDHAGPTAGADTPPPFDLDGLIGGLTRGHLPDADAISRAVRRWGFGPPDAADPGDVTNVTSSERNAPNSPQDGAPKTESDPAPEPATDTADPHATVTAPPPGAASSARIPDGEEVLGEVVEEPEPAEEQRDQSPPGPFPSAAQVREVIAILKDAGERIQEVLDPPRR